MEFYKAVIGTCSISIVYIYFQIYLFSHMASLL
jgi:hypothetical protein